jgi:ABC-type nitrate/sulfonate/bicarbonate transport system substrate-binding protein
MGNDNPEPESSAEKLDEVLPDSLDRRTFIASAVSVSAAGLAGCAGGEGDSSSGTPSGDVMSRDIVWRADWTVAVNNVVTIMAEHEGFLEEYGASITKAERGFGSGDTTRRIGTAQDNERLGKANFVPVMNGIDAGQDVKIIGTDRPRSALGLIYEEGTIDDPTSMSGRDIAVAPSLQTTYAMWEVANDMGSPDNLSNNLQSVEESAHPASLESGDIDASWHTTDTFADYDAQTDINLVFEPLYAHFPTVEDVLITNGEWLEQEDNVEFVSRCLTAHSHCAKYIMTNPEEAVDILREDLNPDLQLTEREVLVTGMKTGLMSLALRDEVRNQGYNFMNEDVVGTSMDNVAEAYDLDLPDYEEVAATEVQEQADLATYTDEEWSQIQEYVGEWTDLLE